MTIRFHSEAIPALLSAGLSVIPACRATKVPLVAWKPFQERVAGVDEAARWFSNGSNADAVGIVCGKVSGNLEALDFDMKAEAFDLWSLLVEDQAPGLLDDLVSQRTQSGGLHILYRCETPPPGNQKLASKLIDGKAVALIESRGEGGYILAEPTEGYEIGNGSFQDIPTITQAERAVLVGVARSLDELEFVAEDKPPRERAPGDLLPGDDFNARGDVRAVLEAHGWVLVRDAGDREIWRRPGKEGSHSATLTTDGQCFYNFSANGHPFEPMKSYSPFGVVAMLEHGGDFAAAARALAAEGYGMETASPAEEPKGSPRSAFDIQSVDDYRASRFLDDRPPERKWLLVDSLLEGSTGLIVADGGVGKGFAGLQIGVSYAAALPVFDGVFRPGCEGAVFCIFAEDSEADLHWRVHAIAQALGGGGDLKDRLHERLFVQSVLGHDLEHKLTEQHDGNLRTTRALDDLLRTLEKVRDLKLVLIDPLIQFHGGVENDNGHSDHFMGALSRICKNTGATVLCSHHVNKPAGALRGVRALGQQAARGGSGFTNAARWQLQLAYAEECEVRSVCDEPFLETNYLVGKTVKKNSGRPEMPFWLERGEHGILRRIDPEVIQEDQETRDRRVLDEVIWKISELQAGGEYLSARDFCRRYAGTWMGYGRPKLERVIGEAVAKGSITVDLRQIKGTGRPKEVMTLGLQK